VNIKINGQTENLNHPSLTVSELLHVKNVEMPDMVSVELNGSILERDAFSSTAVKEGDEVEFLYFMGGGTNYTRCYPTQKIQGEVNKAEIKNIWLRILKKKKP